MGLGGLISIIWTPATSRELYDHSGAIAAAAGFLSLVPGVDVVAGPVAVVFGGISAYKDRHHPVSLVFDIAGSIGGGVALKYLEVASKLDALASEMRYWKYAVYLRQDAAAFRRLSRTATLFGTGSSSGPFVINALR